MSVAVTIDILVANKVLKGESLNITYSFFTVFELCTLLLYFKFITPGISFVKILAATALIVISEVVFYFTPSLAQYEYGIVSVEYLILLIICLVYFYSKATAQPPTPNLWQSNRLWAVLAIFIYVTSGFLYFTFFNNIPQQELEKSGLINLPAIAVILRNIVLSISFLKKQP